ncbi:hypothetical protein DFR86_00990 [Acidianus sulfidivorans JP7]|uniref:Uncharacterized protein n=1 Tax=Acidianus sulfidivorans JP7 TaxID=619593 RepID=A0A2U9IJN9_9CREN|nr:hypothetical protein [Acidianus sulfidivorans]AWR96257.1 hypothetical protein DFR86_00990 [Acidianus sulfidivorans JP7]
MKGKTSLILSTIIIASLFLIVMSSVQFDLFNVSFNISSTPVIVYNESKTYIYPPNVSFILNFSELNISITESYFYFLYNQSEYVSNYYTNITVFITPIDVNSPFQEQLAVFRIELLNPNFFRFGFFGGNESIYRFGYINNLTASEALKLFAANSSLEGEYKVWVLFSPMPNTIPPQTPKVLPAIKINNVIVNIEFIN